MEAKVKNLFSNGNLKIIIGIMLTLLNVIFLVSAYAYRADISNIKDNVGRLEKNMTDIKNEISGNTVRSTANEKELAVFKNDFVNKMDRANESLNTIQTDINHIKIKLNELP
jgi:predicted  nucleic acid-binding Zn-ribbon protein